MNFRTLKKKNHGSVSKVNFALCLNFNLHLACHSQTTPVKMVYYLVFKLFIQLSSLMGFHVLLTSVCVCAPHVLLVDPHNRRGHQISRNWGDREV